MNATTPITILLLVVVAAGCGGSDDKSASAPTIRNAAPWTEQQVLQAAGLTSDADGLSYETASGCSVSVVLTSPQAVNLYADAGDTVVTNPDGSAGVKTSGDEPDCLAELQRGLSTLKRP